MLFSEPERRHVSVPRITHVERQRSRNGAHRGYVTVL
jgi:hypothetical protein